MAPGSIDGKPRIYEAEPTDQFCYNFVIPIFFITNRYAKSYKKTNTKILFFCLQKWVSILQKIDSYTKRRDSSLCEIADHWMVVNQISCA